ncbi:MAG: hypothetical protein ACRDIU_02055 [Actinomycetota bacterium]
MDDEKIQLWTPGFPLHEQAIVVRGGIMDVRDLKKQVQTFADRGKQAGKDEQFALSIFSLPNKTAEEICKIVCLPHQKVRVAEAGAVYRSGFDLIPDNKPPGHLNLVFGSAPTEVEFERLQTIFGEPIPNPARWRAEQ